MTGPRHSRSRRSEGFADFLQPERPALAESRARVAAGQKQYADVRKFVPDDMKRSSDADINSRISGTNASPPSRDFRQAFERGQDGTLSARRNPMWDHIFHGGEAPVYGTGANTAATPGAPKVPPASLTPPAGSAASVAAVTTVDPNDDSAAMDLHQTGIPAPSATAAQAPQLQKGATTGSGIVTRQMRSPGVAFPPPPTTDAQRDGFAPKGTPMQADFGHDRVAGAKSWDELMAVNKSLVAPGGMMKPVETPKPYEPPVVPGSPSTGKITGVAGTGKPLETPFGQIASKESIPSGVLASDPLPSLVPITPPKPKPSTTMTVDELFGPRKDYTQPQASAGFNGDWDAAEKRRRAMAESMA